MPIILLVTMTRHIIIVIEDTEYKNVIDVIFFVECINLNLGMKHLKLWADAVKVLLEIKL
jgi:hypothetical protein